MVDVDALQSEFNNNSIVRGCKLLVRLKDGCIFIEGRTQSYWQKQIALHLASQHIKGSRQLNRNLGIPQEKSRQIRDFNLRNSGLTLYI